MSAYIPTLVGYSGALLAVIGLAFLMAWLRDRRSGWLLWASLPCLIGFSGNLALVSDELLPELHLYRLGATLLLLAYGCIWQAIRSFQNRSSVIGWVVLPVLLWTALSAAVFDPWHLPVANAVGRALLVALFNGLAAWELRRDDRPELPSRPAMFWLLAVFSGVGVGRACLAGVLPAPLGGEMLTGWSVALLNLFGITEALVVPAFMIALSRERVALANYEIALRDPLTGLLNRRALLEQAALLDRDGRRAITTVLLCDIDRFKSINDRFGHATGDVVIRLVAETAAQSLGDTGQVFRFGGEEFVCLLPGLSGQQALLRAERFRHAFAAAASTVSGHPVGATISIGIATGQMPIEALIGRADDALYEAKRGGRDQSVQAAQAAARCRIVSCESKIPPVCMPSRSGRPACGRCR